MRTKTSVRGSIGQAQRAALVERGLNEMHSFAAALKEDQFEAPPPMHKDGTTSPKSKLKKQRADDAMVRIERIVKHLDMTTVTAPYGATLLRLDKTRFDAFEAAVLKVHRNEYQEDGSLVTKSLPWSKHSLENSAAAPVSAHEELAMSAPPLPDFELMRVMMASNIQDYLKRIPFLAKVPMSRIQMLGEMSQFEVLPPDTIVCREGEEGDRVFVVIFGQLAVYAKKEPANGNKLQSPQGLQSSSPGKLLGTLGQGDHFGEMSVLADIPRQATVQSKSACLLVSISRSHFRNLMKVVPDVGESVQTVMRLYMLSKFFQSLLYSETLTKMVQYSPAGRVMSLCVSPSPLNIIFF